MAEINIGQISEALNDKLDRDCVNVEPLQKILAKTDFTNVTPPPDLRSRDRA